MTPYRGVEEAEGNGRTTTTIRRLRRWHRLPDFGGKGGAGGNGEIATVVGR